MPKMWSKHKKSQLTVTQRIFTNRVHEHYWQNNPLSKNINSRLTLHWTIRRIIFQATTQNSEEKTLRHWTQYWWNQLID